MDALVIYNDSESEDEYEDREAVADDDVPAIHSDDTRRQDLTVLSPSQNKVSSLRSFEEDSSVAYEVDNFFNLAEQTNISVTDDLHSAQFVCNSELHSRAQNEYTADFWNADLPAEDWSCPEKIWGVTLDTTENEAGHVNDNILSVTSDSEGPQIKGYSSKRCQSDVFAEMPASSELFGSMRKRFMVHHKVAPYLHAATQSTNRIPRKVLCVLPGHSGTVNRIHWNIPEYSNLLLTASMDATVRVWNVLSSRDSDPCVCTLKVHSKAVRAARWSACGRRILSCSYDKFARLTDVEHGNVVCLSICLSSVVVTIVLLL